MTIPILELTQICKDALDIAHRTIQGLGDRGTAEVRVINKRGYDISVKGDIRVSKEVTKFLRQKKFPAVLYTEEFGRIELVKNPLYTITFDDIDGTNNYHRSYHHGKSVLPYCSIITIFDSIKPRFENALVTAVMEHNTSWLWTAAKNHGTYFNGNKVITSRKTSFGKKRKTLVVIDHYMGAKDVPRFSKIYKRAWVKDFGTSALHLAMVSNGMLDAYISPDQKAHELGGGLLLITESGGSVTDFQGKPLDKIVYDFNKKYPIIAASTPKLGNALVHLIP